MVSRVNLLWLSLLRGVCLGDVGARVSRRSRSSLYSSRLHPLSRALSPLGYMGSQQDARSFSGCGFLPRSSIQIRTMVSVREEARMLVSAVAREARRCPPPTAGPCWFSLPFSQPSPPSPSQVDWGLREVSWAPHRVLTEQLCHLTRFWESSASLALSSATSKSCQVAATLRTVPCNGGKGRTLREVLHSLSGQIELFYLATHAGLQSLRYFCCFAPQPGLHPGLQEDLIRAVDKAYETLVVGVWRCSRLNARLQSAYQTTPESFHENVLTPTPIIFSIAHDSEDGVLKGVL
ncbi:hypothetical protein C7M84_004277 [Penaeus vannamei]|uniref:Uncharacterized protein n=1 Tax=Penaeus vannamei TaxID=6689 RepID=A0A423TL03_PENVA|nr:hypothetical protein C7M84_004277 [Penaeus vannamei]